MIYWLHNARLWGVYKLGIFKHAIVGIAVSNEWWLGIKQGHSDMTFVWLLKVDLFSIVLPDKKHRFEWRKQVTGLTFNIWISVGGEEQWLYGVVWFN